MGWNEYYRRRDIMDAALSHAHRSPQAPLLFAEQPGAVELFGSEEALLRALHHHWTVQLGGRLRTELGNDIGSAEGEMHTDAVTRAWHATVAANPTLRTVLDTASAGNPAALRVTQDVENRMIAIAAGLAEPGESPETVSQVGAAFIALLRARPVRQATRRNPVEQLLRRFAASA